MRLSLLFKISFFLAAGFLISPSCSSDKAKEPLKARIVVSTASGYKVETVTFNSLRDADKMDGDTLQFLGNAKININAGHDVIVSEHPQDLYLNRGEVVALDYVLKDGVIKPLSFDSMAMLSAYYHYEKITEFWRDFMALDLADYGKFKVLYDPDMAAKGDGLDLIATIKINAAFMPGTRDFLLFKTSKRELLPIKMNLGILAHEFAHGVFDYQFAKKDSSIYLAKNTWASKQLSGINEGLADYYSWMVTGRVEEAEASLESLLQERRLPVKWTSKGLVNNPYQCDGGFYCKGSVLASALYEIAETKGLGAVPVGKVVYLAIDAFRADWLAHKDDENRRDGNVKNIFDYHYLINRIIEKSEANKSTYCEVFMKWFDDSVNLVEIKKLCVI